MPRAATRDPIYRDRRFSTDVIEQCVRLRWYITYRLSYRDLVTAAMPAACHQGFVAGAGVFTGPCLRR